MPLASLSDKEKRIYCSTEKVISDVLSRLEPYPDLHETGKNVLKLSEPAKKTPLQIGIIGEQSAGKSTFLNSICGYPILPTASVITSACPVEIRKSREDFIQVLWEEDGAEKCVDLRHQFEKEFVTGLLDYALCCYRNDMIACDNLNYLTSRQMKMPDGSKTELEIRDFDYFDPCNPRQIWMLLMILLGSYVGNPSEQESDIREKIKLMRHQMLTELGINADAEYFIRLFWNSDALSTEDVIIDLPGMRDAAGRATVTEQYIDRVDCVVVLFNPDPYENDLYQFLCNFLQLEHMKLAENSCSRVIAVMNKADACDGGIPAKLRQIRQKCAVGDALVIYPICAINGEYAYVKNGDIDIHATLRYKKMQSGTACEISTEEVLRAMQKAYAAPYPYGEDDKSVITLSQVQEKITCSFSTRLYCLHWLWGLDQVVDGMHLIKNEIALQRSLLTFLEQCGRPIAKQLSEALTQASSQTLYAFLEEFREASEKLSERMKSQERFQEAKTLYCQDLQQLETDIDKTVESYVRKMKRSFFKIKLSNETNKAVFDELIAWLSGEKTVDGNRLVISGYLKRGNSKLDLALGYQKLKYAEGVADLVRCYRRFPDIFAEAWDEAYCQVRAELLSGQSALTEESLAAYDEQARILKESGCSFISRLAEHRIDLLRADKSVEAEFSATANIRRNYMEELERFYYKKCPQMLRRCQKEYLLSTEQYLTHKELKTLFKNKSYSAEAKQVFIRELDMLLTQDSSQHRGTQSAHSSFRFVQDMFSQLYRKLRGTRSHQERVMNAVSKLSRQFYSGTEQELRSFCANIKKDIKSLIGSGKSTYTAEKQELDALNAELRSVWSVYRSDIGDDLVEISQTDDLSDDVKHVLDKLAKL